LHDIAFLSGEQFAKALDIQKKNKKEDF